MIRAEATEQSDIDVLADFHDHADLFDFVGLSLFLEEKLNHRADVVPERDIRKALKEIILRETVYL